MGVILQCPFKTKLYSIYQFNNPNIYFYNQTADQSVSYNNLPQIIEVMYDAASRLERWVSAGFPVELFRFNWDCPQIYNIKNTGRAAWKREQHEMGGDHDKQLCSSASQYTARLRTVIKPIHGTLVTPNQHTQHSH